MSLAMPMRPGSVLTLCGLLLCAGPGAARAASPGIDDLATVVRQLVHSEDEGAPAQVVELVRRGLPPHALVAFLSAARQVPRADYSAVLQELVHYRRAEIRGRSIAALVVLGGSPAGAALLRGLDDPDQRVRQLSVQLTDVYSDPAVQEALMALREREPELFEAEPDLIVTEVDPPEAEEEVMVLEERE